MKNTAYFLISMIAIVVVLIFGKSLLIPFIFALLLWFIVRKIRHFMDRIKFIKNVFPTWLKSLIPSVILLIVLGFISKLLVANINSLAQSYPLYESNVELMIASLNELLQIDLVNYFSAHSGDFDFGTVLQHIFKSLTDLLSNAFIIVLYALFIFLEEANFNIKLKAVFTGNTNYESLSLILDKIENSITSYMGLKTLVSFITGLASYIILIFIGIDAPLFWAFLIFLLNFIPTIGSLIGTIFPAMFCLLQFGAFNQAFLVLGLVGGIQVIVGNIIEPKLMGNSLNISPLVAILALSFWGALWGVTGMLLSVPITVIMVIVFAHFSSTKAIAIMLSEKGKI